MKEKRKIFHAKSQRRKGLLFASLRLCGIFCFLLISNFLRAQSPEHLSMIKEHEIAMRPLAKELLKAPTDEARDVANKKFIKLLEEVLQVKESFHYNFDSLINLKTLTSDDEKIRVYTWPLPSVDGNNYIYFGYIQVMQTKGGILGLFNNESYVINTRLADATNNIPDPQNTKLKPDHWFGAWYYKLITNKYLGKTHYTLLGWKGRNKLVTMKVIDYINVSSDGKITLGAPVFKDANLSKDREIFEFSAGVSMSLHYEADKKITAFEKADKTKKRKLVEYKNVIVFDHIAAPEGKEGQQQFSGPDLSIDAYSFQNGKWIMLHDVDDKPSSVPLPPPKYHAPKGIYQPAKKK